MKRFLTSAALPVLCLALYAQEPSPAAAPPAPPPQVLTPELINRLAGEMLTNSPALRAARSRTRAASASAGSVRVWEDPKLVLGAMLADQSMRSEDGDILYGIDQKLPLFGKPGLERKEAEAMASAEQATGDYLFQRQRSELSRALFDAALATETLEISREDLHWTETMLRTAEERYRAGGIAQAQVLRLQNDRSRRADQIQTAAQRLADRDAVLNRILNRPLRAPWPRLLLPAPAPALPYSSRLREVALRNEPGLKVARRQAEQAEAALNRTKRSRVPDLSLGFEGRNYSGSGEFRQGMVLLGFNVPLGNSGRYRRDVEREEFRLEAAGQETEARGLEITEEVHHLTVEIDAARREALLYRDEILPRSEQALTAAHNAWLSGAGMFLDVMDARRMLIEGRLEYARAVADQYRSLSQLVLCCGLGDLTALLRFNAGPAQEDPPTPSHNP